jgi:flagellar basal body-associated protein FliL
LTKKIIIQIFTEEKMRNKSIQVISILVILLLNTLTLFGQNIVVFDDKYKGVPLQEIDGLPVFTIVEKMPEYIGGYQAKDKFIKDSLNYSSKNHKSDPDYQSSIVVQYVIDTSGFTTNIWVVKRKYTDHYTEFEKASMIMISKMPKWKPGEQNGKKVPVKFNEIVSPKKN